MCSSGVAVIGLIVPSNAPVFVGGESAYGVAASPFVQGQSTSHHHDALGTHIGYSSSCRGPESPRVGPCVQCGPAGFHHLRREYGPVHWLPNPVRTGGPEANPENLPKSDKVGGSRLRATCLLALHLSRLYESRRGTTRWYDPSRLPSRRTIDPSNSLQLPRQRVCNVWRNYVEYVIIRLRNGFSG